MGRSITRRAPRNFTFNRPNDTIKNDVGMQADVAQLVEQLIRNQQVVSSSLTVGSRIRMTAWPLECERSFLLPRVFRVAARPIKSSPARAPGQSFSLSGSCCSRTE
jgi:hypothetical protein